MSNEKQNVSRRSFMKTSAATSASFAAALQAFKTRRAVAAAAGSGDVGAPINLAVIGSGNMGCGDMVQALRIPGVYLKAICDIWPPNLEMGLQIARDEHKLIKYFTNVYEGFRSGKDKEDAIKAAKAAKGYADYKEMLDKEKDIDAVIIATPLHTHCEIACACIDAGKHIYSEKMMAKTVEECHKLGKKAKDSDKVVQFGHQQHWNGWYKLGYKLLHNDKVCGEVTHINAHWNRNKSWYRPVPDQHKNLIDASKFGYKDVNQLRNWRLFWDTSGGLMAELACHQVDVANWYLGKTPTAVTGMGGLNFRDDWNGDVFDNVQVIYEFPGGIKMIYQSITTNAHDGQGEKFMGTEGTVELSRKGGQVYREPSAAKLKWGDNVKKDQTNTGIQLKQESTIRAEGEAKQEGKALKGADTKDPYHDYRMAMGAWFTCIRENKKPKADWKMAMDAAIPCILANEAMKKKERIEIKPEVYEV